MFTGLVQELAKVHKAELSGQDLRLTLRAPEMTVRLRVGDSVAVNGCCLTVVEVSAPFMTFQAVPETIQRTALGSLKEGMDVNLEKPLTLEQPLGGHYVQGHVDGLSTIMEMKPEGLGMRMKVRVPEYIVPYVVEKGSIALDGISLTVASIKGAEVEVALIPHTVMNTNLRAKKPGDLLQTEADMLAKHLEKLAAAYLKR